ncbi:MAG: hypothetical protein AB7Y46_01855 [Armatimonadota bacterium]
MTEWESDELSWLSEEAQRLVRFACTRMVHSYKPVLMGIFLDELPNLRLPMRVVAQRFADYYRERWEAGLPVERRGCRFCDNHTLDREICLIVPYHIVRDVFLVNGWATVAAGEVWLIPPRVWQELAAPSAQLAVRRALRRALSSFFERIELQGEAVYGRTKRHAEADAHGLVSFMSDPDDAGDLFVLPGDH